MIYFNRDFQATLDTEYRREVLIYAFDVNENDVKSLLQMYE